MMNQNETETKIFYYIDDEETPYLVKVAVPLSEVTLADFKNILQRPNYKFFFKSLDADFGVVKEEIVEDSSKLPAFKGRVVSWLVTAEGSNVSDNASQVTATTATTENTTDRHHKHKSHQKDKRHHVHHMKKFNYDSSSVMTSDLESSTVLDSDEDSDLTSRMSTTTDESSVSRVYQRHLRRRRKKKLTAMSGTSSVSSVTDSSMSLNIITVALNLDSVNFLGISIVGQSNRGGDGGIYVGSIMKGGAVAQDGRIEPGDMILQVNDDNFDNMSNDDAVKVLREAVQKPGPIKLVVAKCWDPNPKGYFTIPRTEQVRPIDPGAWVAHTEAALNNQLTNEIPLRPPSVSTITSSSLPETELDSNPLISLSVDASSMQSITEVMAAPDSGLDVRDRMWLKITIRNAFLGSDCVDWLVSHVQGFHDRKEAKKYATLVLKEGFIKHTVNKSNFSEQCYYVFSDDVVKRMHELRMEEGHDLLGAPTGWTMGPQMPPYTGSYIPQPFLTHTQPYQAYANEVSYVNFGREGSINSSAGSGGSGGPGNGILPKLPKLPTVANNHSSDTSSSSSEHDSQSLLAAPNIPSNPLVGTLGALVAQNTSGLPPVPPPNGSSGPQKSTSRDSFHMAMNGSGGFVNLS